MRAFAKRVIGSLVVAALVIVPLSTTALAQNPIQVTEPSAESMAVDLIVLRPLGIVSLAAGTTLFIASLPFSALGGNVDQAAEKLMKDPAKFTFTRKLGDL